MTNQDNNLDYYKDEPDFDGMPNYLGVYLHDKGKGA